RQFSVSYISAVERGQIRPSLGALERLAERLEVPLAELMQDRDSTPYGFVERSSREGYGTYGDRQREDVEAKLREGMLLIFARRFNEAIEVLQSLTGRTLSLHDQVLLRWRLAQCYTETEQGDDARREAQEGLVLAERVGDVELREHLRNALGNALFVMRKYPQALDHYRACDDAVEQGLMKDPLFALNVLYNLGAVYWALGDTATAMTYLVRAAEDAQTATHPERLAERYQALSESYAAANDQAHARLYAQRGIASFEEARTLRLTGRIYALRGRAMAQDGQTAEALASLRAALQLAEEQQDMRGAIEAQRGLATLYIAQSKMEDAIRAINDAIGRSEVIHDPIERAESLLVLAQTQEARKDHAEAENSYNQAIQLLKDEGATQRLGDAYRQLSGFLERRGQSKKALDLLKQAWELREGIPVG
ncbi:MAG TPA: tetratricopeptide repeat protein, partial [Ktedonobacterales bacterium]|nr:tetratricopeptide repeat protein [Ktedonobacterales bacterium]